MQVQTKWRKLKARRNSLNLNVCVLCAEKKQENKTKKIGRKLKRNAIIYQEDNWWKTATNTGIRTARTRNSWTSDYEHKRSELKKPEATEMCCPCGSCAQFTLPVLNSLYIIIAIVFLCLRAHSSRHIQFRCLLNGEM